MSAKDEIDTISELYLGKPSKYEWVRTDKTFHDVFKGRVVAQDRLRVELEKRTGERLFKNWKDLTKEIADKHLRNKII
jgi:hypothetical protein